MQKVLVTGASGFIGRHVIQILEEKGFDYLGLSNSTERQNIKQCSLTDFNTLHEICASYKPDTVIHLGAIACPTYGNSLEVYNVNVIGTENLLNSVVSFKPRFLFASTAGVYGNQTYYQIPEEASYSPVNHYSCSKAITEMLLNGYKESMEICVCRLFNVIGNGQNKQFIVPKLVNAFKKKSDLIRLGNIKSERDFIDVDYVAKVFVKLSQTQELPFNLVNICSGTGNSCEDIINDLIQMTNHKPNLEISSQFVRKNEISRLVGSNNRLIDFMGYQPKGLEEVLQEMLASSDD